MKFSSPESLSEFYRVNGYLGPRSVFSARELADLNIVQIVQELNRAEDGWARNRHMDLAQIRKLAFDERLIQTVKSLVLGDLVLWRSNIFEVPVGSAGLIWHRDTYPGFASDVFSDDCFCSVQVNLSSSSPDNCVSVIPGSHRWDDLELVEKGYVPCPSLAKEGHGSSWGIPAATETMDIPLLQGECFVFHAGLLHASSRGRGFTADIARNYLSGNRSWFAGMNQGSLSGAAAASTCRYSITFRLASRTTTIAPAAFEEGNRVGQAMAWKAPES
jgi:hypothetical protein